MPKNFDQNKYVEGLAQIAIAIFAFSIGNWTGAIPAAAMGLSRLYKISEEISEHDKTLLDVLQKNIDELIDAGRENLTPQEIDDYNDIFQSILINSQSTELAQEITLNLASNTDSLQLNIEKTLLQLILNLDYPPKSISAANDVLKELSHKLCSIELLTKQVNQNVLYTILQRQSVYHQDIQTIVETLGNNPISLYVPQQQQSEHYDTFVEMRFEEQKTSFVGRDNEMQQLDTFMINDSRLSWWQVSGEGGHGKSRLALELIKKYQTTWYTGFLSKQNLLSTDWNKLDFSIDTLIVIDYIAASEKSLEFAHAIRILNQRISDKMFHKDIKIRFLVLERDGFAIDDDVDPLRRTNSEDVNNYQVKLQPQNWLIDLLCDAQLARHLISTVFKRHSLELKPLDILSMQQVINSWRLSRDKSTLSAAQNQRVLKSLNDGSDRFTFTQSQTWRPLFAILYAEIFDELAINQTISRDILLAKIIKQERSDFWQVNQPSVGAINLAALATMVNGVNKTDLIIKLKTNYASPKDLEGFYEIDGSKPLGDILIQTLNLLGYGPRENLEIKDIEQFEPRTPDLLGEYLVLSYLESTYCSGFSSDRQAIEKLAQDAWSYSPHDYIQFMSRIKQDFPYHNITGLLINIEPKKSEVHDKIFNEISISWLANNGLVGLLKKQLDFHHQNISYLNINSEDAPLMHAVQNNHSECAKILIENGANINFFSKVDGTFPLLRAAMKGSFESLKILIEEGAEINMPNGEDGVSSLTLAAQNNHKQCVEFMINNGAKVNHLPNQKGLFPLLQASLSGNYEVAKILIDHGANINLIDGTEGAFPLLLAAQGNNIEILKLLISRGAQVDNELSDISPLVVSAHLGHSKISRLLIKNGANISRSYSVNGCFPLLNAAEVGDEKTVELLLLNDADVNQKSSLDGRTALISTMEKGCFKIAQLLIDGGAEINHIDSSGLFPLLLAAQNGYIECVKLLLDSGAKVNLIEDVEGAFPLLLASERGYYECVEVLILAGASINASNAINGTFPLMQAVQQKHIKTIEILIDKDADINQTDFFNVSPLIRAVYSSNIRIIKILLDNGVNTQVDFEGSNLIEFASEHASNEVVELLKNFAFTRLLKKR
ncbi:ankyrin repeat domain-containing protein [Psychrobacter frigidicola]|uniref:ankyrin repeat domain-containing protein n=1 Tax=Psychrobacter frigidicola TaxID=45611 RepID=UPI001D122754|nr:ankyrin repeat domain-containing protein [Psychrobacter frigidicola]